MKNRNQSSVPSELSTRVRSEIARMSAQFPDLTPRVSADELAVLALRHPRFSRVAELLKIADAAGGAHDRR